MICQELLAFIFGIRCLVTVQFSECYSSKWFLTCLCRKYTPNAVIFVSAFYLEPVSSLFPIKCESGIENS